MWKSWLKTQHPENEDHGIWSHHFMKTDGETVETGTDFIFLGSKITADGDCSHEIERHMLLGRKTVTNRQHIKKQRRYFADKDPSSQRYGFSSTHVQMWKLDQKKAG